MARHRMWTSLAAVALSAGLVAACGGPGGGDQPTGGPNEDGVTTLSVWVFAELHGAFYEQMAESWNEENPDRQIELDITVYPYQDMHNKLQLALNSGEGLPDLVDIEVNKFSNFVRGDNPPLVDLTEAAQPYIDDVVQARLDLYSRDGKIYGYPTHVGAMVAFYNATLLEEAGIDYTTIRTWDDFEEAGVQYHEATGKEFGIASTEVFFTEPLTIAQLGGNIFDESGNVSVDNPEVTEAMEMWQGMLEAGAISTIPGGSPDSEEGYGAINNGDYAAVVYPAWYTSRFVDYMPDLEGDIAIAPAPVVEGSDVLTIGGGGTGMSIPKGSPNEELAADWLAYAKLSPEANVAVWEVLGFDPVNMAVWEDEAVTHNPDNKFNQYFQTNVFDVLNEVKDGISHFEGFANPDLPAVNNTFTTVTLTEIYENGRSVPDALAQAQSDLQTELGQ